jgi:hypothetical protein
MWIDGSSDFNDFNVSGLPVGTMVARRELAQWVCKSREGRSWAMSYFASTMYWTLRPPAFEAYLRLHSEVAIAYQDWFYSKMLQFGRVLLDSDPATPFMERPPKGRFRIPDYSDSWLECDNLPEDLVPQDNERLQGLELVRTVSEDPEDRAGALWAWLKQQRQTPDTRNESPETARRNNLIRQAYAKGQRGRQICEFLDRNGVPTTKPMQKAEVRTWVTAWDDADFKKNVRTMISKAVKSVKPQAISTKFPNPS